MHKVYFQPPSKKKINALFDLLHVWKEKKQNAVGGRAITWLRGAITILGEVLVLCDLTKGRLQELGLLVCTL